MGSAMVGLKDALVGKKSLLSKNGLILRGAVLPCQQAPGARASEY